MRWRAGGVRGSAWLSSGAGWVCGNPGLRRRTRWESRCPRLRDRSVPWLLRKGRCWLLHAWGPHRLLDSRIGCHARLLRGAECRPGCGTRRRTPRPGNARNRLRCGAGPAQPRPGRRDAGGSPVGRALREQWTLHPWHTRLGPWERARGQGLARRAPLGGCRAGAGPERLLRLLHGHRPGSAGGPSQLHLSHLGLQRGHPGALTRSSWRLCRHAYVRDHVERRELPGACRIDRRTWHPVQHPSSLVPFPCCGAGPT